jgi:hypothetical protein
LRARGDRPCCNAAKGRDELAPPHDTLDAPQADVIIAGNKSLT